MVQHQQAELRIAVVADHGNVECGMPPSSSSSSSSSPPPSTAAATATRATAAAVASASASSSASASAVPASDDGKRSATPPATATATPSYQKQKSTLSRGKLQFIKKHFRSTPWYDTEELLSVGHGLLIALQLFPMVPPSAAEAVAASASSGGGAGEEVSTTDYLIGVDEGGKEGQNRISSVGQNQQLPLLSPADCHRLQQSLRRVAVWKGSSRGTKIGGGDSAGGGGGGVGGGGGSVLPHAIESTACLAGILWADAMASSLAMDKSTSSISKSSSSINNGVANLNQLRNAYSSAIIRSVNALADSYRRIYSNTSNGFNTDMPPPSVSHCAGTLAGLPAWIVDVRHDASHGAALPTIHVCRLASLEILRYWKDKYWTKVEEKVWGEHRVVGEESVECGMHTQAYDILARYQTSAILELRSSSSGGGGGGGGARHLSADRNGLGRRDHRQQQQRPTSMLPKPPQSLGARKVVGSVTNESMEMERSGIEENTKDNNNTEQGMIHVPSVDDRNNNGNDKCVDKGKSNDTTRSTTLTTDNNRRRQRSRTTESGGAIPWWILMDDDAPAMQKKKRKKKSKDGDAVSDDKTNDNLSATDPTDEVSIEPLAAAPTPTTTVATTRDCALEFIRTIPLDIAYSTCLCFLVWGLKSTVEDGRQSTAANTAVAFREYDDDNGDGRVQNNVCPALLTLPSDFLPRCDQRAEAPEAAATEAAVEEEKEAEFDSSFEHLRIMYEPLLVTMTTVYPGFAPALFVHLVDSIICLEKIAGDESHDEKQLDCYIQYLSRWVQYLLSRAFHMHLNRLVAMFAPDEAVMQHVQQQQSIPNPSQQSTQQLSQASNREENIKEKSLPRPVLVDLKKRGRKKWNTAQLRYMQSPLDFPSLRDIGFPLNSACDRLLLFDQQRSTNTSRKVTTSKVIQLHQYLQDVIGKEDRMSFMGVSELRSDRAVMEGLKAHDEPLLMSVTSNTTNMMSLEDMEAMLGDGDRKDGGGATTCNHSLDKDNYGPTGLIEEKMHIVTPWTLCKSWDACAIGTMSGCPS